MKTVSLLAVLVVAVCLIGCENAELIDCQQDKDMLQGQVDQATAAISEKDTEIESLEAKNINSQNLAMESITTMMTKQAEKDKQDQQKIGDLKEKVAALEAQINTHVCPAPEVVIVEEVEIVEEVQE